MNTNLSTLIHHLDVTRAIQRGLWPGKDHLRLAVDNPPTARSKRETG